MMIRRIFTLISLCVTTLIITASVEAQVKESSMPELIKHKNGQYGFYVDGSPYLILGGQSGNSNNWPAMHPQLFETMKKMNANTLEVPIYWEAIEPTQGQYDMSSVKLIIDEARKNDIRLILLWFATWKNGSNHYMPEWMKLDSKQYFNVVGINGQPIDSPSPHCKAAMELDAKAFAEVMSFLKEYDKCHTVIMVQVQNEPGTWNSVRDYSKSVDKLFNSNVPDALLKPSILKELGAKQKKGTWNEVFGDRADEYFHAWNVASYIDYVAAAGKAVNPLPMYVNAALRDPFGNPLATQYESGGPTDNVICIYKAAAPHIDLLAPDIYQRGDANYMKVVELYTRPDNCLMVPETGTNPKYLYEVISRGIGFSPFGVDGGRIIGPLSDEYKMLVPIADKISKWRLEGRLYTAFEPENHAVQYRDLGEWQAIFTFGPARRSNVQGEKDTSTRPATGHAMLVKLNENEYFAFGTDVRYSFKPQGKNAGKAWHYLRVEEGEFDKNGKWLMRRVLNGDQTDWTGPYVGKTPTVLRIKLYTRELRK
ncbi:DUF5597 domain-containing protein [Bacteroides uniformis]|uniref:DUF5597 domain-containing protein n=1 Tax=Bacteroides uniformis TaxID=820 RepID=UPI001E3704FC|nr:DUF5597 domain-containing protein [Bacteroides uniformis]